ncbi:phosphoribosylaminoimidazolesuccinocarboxamide synthase [Candidatus Nomurabacteria bacterium CG10_big_fil_rev_8_21_14_0_10_35_16]|uniref:Phosphoribosylaminoimidazole-succinocarboxamide synthase n=1 Tax=Candidatus Nomurabacteria bacterium CG10_big_fil_rev_8_21_14_0_10_35_16 TaxID=1974731 RepID=A0A2H0TAK9_9BACT|nr:MAG: phosphoribosylaminoimidazolesuccinocarboxamide synthase [Candidatus Nomurabacteria bacterium CG10_big_fil_rev_8_21_14_0_10_35_16]
MDIEKIKEHIDDVLTETNFTNLGERKVGKVRDVYIEKDQITLISTDRHSSFDRIIAHIPFKGEILNQTSLFWFENTKDIIQNHVLANPDPNVAVVKKCKVIPIEMVVRGYITGSTNTSLWTLYKNGERDFGNFTLPDGMHKNQKLETPVLTPTTKSDEHDRPITPQEIVSEGIMSQELWDEMADKAIKIFTRGQKVALEKGLILVDTKYEFGLDENNQLTLIDEIHTPDSSRYWQASSYQARIDAGQEPENFDKEFLRLWFKENCDPYNDEKLPDAPVEMVTELTRRYIQIYEQITGKKFEHDFSQTPLERITNNLKQK